MIVITVLILTMFATVSLAGHKIQDAKKGTVKLKSDSSDATGTVKFKVTKLKGHIYKLDIDLTTKDLKPKSGYVYQLWLKDTETSVSEAAGAFQTFKKGKGALIVKTSVPNFSQYDEAVVTEEPKYDEDPMPSGIVVLKGDIAH